MNNRVIKIDTDNTVTEFEIDFGYPGINKALGVEMIEPVRTERLRTWFENVHMIVDEEGLLNGSEYNEAATRLYVALDNRHLRGIVGPALLVQDIMTDEGPDFGGLPDDVTVEEIERLIAFYEDH